MKTKRQRKSSERRRASASRRAEKQRGGIKPYLKLPPNVKLFDFTKEGTKKIDVLEYKVGKGNPEAEPGDWYFERTFYVHKNIGPDNETHLCPKRTFGKPCPVCKHRTKLARTDPDQDEESGDLKPKERQLFAIVESRRKKDGVQILDKSYYLFGQELDAAIKKYKKKHGEDEADKFASPTEGLTVVCEVEEKSHGKANYTNVKMAKLVERDEQYDEDIEVPCLDKCIVETPYEELKELFLQTGDDSDDDDDDEDLDDDDEDDSDDDDESEDDDSDDDEDDDESDEDEDDDEEDEDDDDSDSDDEDGDEDDEDDEDNGEASKGDTVKFTYKGKTRRGVVKRIKGGLAHVKCEGRSDLYAVDLDDCTVISDEKPAKKKKRQRDDDDDDDEDDVPFVDEDDDADEEPRKKKKRRK